jgi:hypothetical protein
MILWQVNQAHGIILTRDRVQMRTLKKILKLDNYIINFTCSLIRYFYPIPIFG